MKFICLGYYDAQKFEASPESDRNAMFDACFAYDDELKKAGHYAGGEALQAAATAKTLRGKNGKVAVTDGPYAETKEQIGGILILEARDFEHAVELMSKHPAVEGGFSTFELRAVGDMSEIQRESEKRRKSKKG
jgi:hypothetical protein